VEDRDEFEHRCNDADYWSDFTGGRGVNMKLNVAFAGRMLLFTNSFDAFLFDLLRKTYGPKLSTEDQDIFDDILAHCRASKVDLDDPAPRRLQISFYVPCWIEATYPANLSPFMLDAPTRYAYSLNTEVLKLAMAIKARLERQGANANNIAERVFVEIPDAYRGVLAAMPALSHRVFVSTTESLGGRVSWIS
jgi:hypothetical protein